MKKSVLHSGSENKIFPDVLRRSFLLFATTFLFLAFLLQDLSALNFCCYADCPRPIIDSDTRKSELLKKGAVKNDLLTATQGECTVCVKFKQDYESDLRRQDFSPSGQSVTRFSPINKYLFKRKNGCDSIQISDLQIKQGFSAGTDQTICSGDSLLLTSKVFKLAEKYGAALPMCSAKSCDSILSLNMNLKLPLPDTITEYICSDSPLPDGYSIQKLVAANGSDSIITIYRIRLPEKKSELQAKVCRSQGIRVGSSFFDKDTICSVVIPNVGPAGCDSTILLELTVFDSLVEYRNIQLCNEETYTYNNVTYRKSTRLRNIFPMSNKCDSIFYLNIDVYACKMRYKLSTRNASCDRDNNGAIVLQMLDSNYINYFYTWEKLNNGVVSSTFLIGGDQGAEIDNLTAGRYLITFDNGAGLIRTDTVTVGKDSALRISATVSDFDGYAVTCHGDSNGSVELSVSGGDPPYRFVWSDGSTTQSRNSLSAGLYSVTISDVLNCVGKFDTILREPDKFAFRIIAKDPLCNKGSDGMILLDSLKNARLPVLYTLNDAPAQRFSSFDKLKAGNYKIKITDDRNCRLDTSVVLNEPPPVTVDVGSDITIYSGETVTLRGSTGIPVSEISKVLWNSIQDNICPRCLEKTFAPALSTRYLLTVFDKNNCSGEDFTYVTVKDLQVFVPNAFSPNDDGSNDYFTVFGDPKSFNVKSMRIYNRWGDLVFLAKDLIPGDEPNGWNGKFKGLVQSDGIYVYDIVLELPNNSVRNLKGEVFLLK